MAGMRETEPVDAVVFDLGGVVLDWDPLHLYEKVFADPEDARRFLAEVCTLEWHAQHDLGTPMDETIPALCAEHPHHADAIRAWRERYIEMIDGTIDGMTELIEHLASSGVPMYALTNMPAEVWPELVEAYPIVLAFDGVVVSGEEFIVKPDPKLFQLLAERFDLAPNRTVFVDDSPRNVDSAWTLGFRAVRFESASQLCRVLWGWGVSVPPDADSG
jgi:2-haloacid dehalogenase